MALALTWRPRGGRAVRSSRGARARCWARRVCAGIGLALAGRLRAEVNLAASNGLYLVLLLLSGIVIPLTSLPSVVRHAVVIALPSGAMADGLHRVLGRGLAPTDS